MYLKTTVDKTNEEYLERLERAKEAIDEAEAIIVGVGAGMSTAAGLVYDGAFFIEHFGDFETHFGIHDMYSGGFYPFPDSETKWAFWSRFAYLERYRPDALKPYTDLVEILHKRNHFILTTNVDHQLQKAGVDKSRLFYTQGDYGLFQCSLPCHEKTYDNEETIMEMYREQEGMRIPSSLIPHCPVCGREMSMNLRSDDTFVEDAGWKLAAERYNAFASANRKARTVYLELGVGGNTPGIIKYPFWRAAFDNSKATYITVNLNEAYYPDLIEKQTLAFNHDIADFLTGLKAE